MRNWITALFLLGITSIKAQDISLNGYLSWFSKVDVQTIKSGFQNTDYRLTGEKDSVGIHILQYQLVLLNPSPNFTFLLGDSSLQQVIIENYDQNVHRGMISHVKANKFKNLGADVNGDFITTSYDNGTFILSQDFEMVDNPSGKGQIPHYRYRIVRKNGDFDAMNGAKKKTETIDGQTYTVIENYKNGVLEGERITYFPGDSIVKKKENYRGGRLNGTVSDFDEKGRLIHSSVHSYHWKYGMEKWYDGEGKLVRSLQWQRDVPVGTEKYNIEGRTFTGPTYKNGKREGLATVPMTFKWTGKYQTIEAQDLLSAQRMEMPEIYFDHYDENAEAIPQEPNWEDRFIYKPSFGAFETVLFVNDQKEGKAVGMAANMQDTLYIGFYKNGVLDSTLTVYHISDARINYLYESGSHSGSNNLAIGYKNERCFQTTLINGLENGKRIFYVTSGPMKGDTSYMESYRNGKLHGTTLRYYKKEKNSAINHPIEGKSSGYYWTSTHFGNWFSEYSTMTYKNGVLDGPFRIQTDSLNYNIGTYADGQLDGRNEVGVGTKELQLKITGNYSKGMKTGEWVTENLLDTTVITENYVDGKKHGISTTEVKGKIIEQRSYVSGYLFDITEFTENGYNKFTLVSNEVPDSYCFKQEEKFEDQYNTYNFTARISDYPKTDTTLILLSNAIGKIIKSAPRLNGKYEITTPDFVEQGTYSDYKLAGVTVIEHKKAGVYEQRSYEKGVVTAFRYTNVSTGEDFTGKFISDVNGDSISVKDGMRHGWYIEYDSNGNEIRRTKYVKGIIKKTIENLSAAQAGSNI